MQHSESNFRIYISLFVLVVLCVGGYLFRASIAHTHAYSFDTVTMDENTYPAVVVGGGVGGLTTSVYLSLANRTNYVLEGDTPGGLLTQSLSVRNWPGEIEAPGAAITSKLRAQAIKRGAHVVAEKLLSVDLEKWPYTLTIAPVNEPNKRRKIRALSLIVAMGAASNYLKIPGEQKYWGRGVTNCAVCEGSLYYNKTVCVVGGGDSAMEEASYLAGIAKKVYVFVRRDQLRAVDSRKDEVLQLNNVEIVYNTAITEIIGNGKEVTSVIARDTQTDDSREYKMDGVFLAIGFTPNTQIFAGQLDRDEGGYIKLYHDQETSRPGVFAIGDIVDPIYKQAVTASGDGCRAALQAHKFLGEVGYTSEPNASVSGSSSVSSPAEVPAQAITQTNNTDHLNKLSSSSQPEFSGEQENLDLLDSENEQALTPEDIALLKEMVEQKITEQITDNSDKRENFANGKVHEIKSRAAFEKIMVQSDGPIVVDYYATWCGPCKMMAPIFKRLARQYRDKVTFVKVNIDIVPELAQAGQIRGVPTFTFLRDGEEIDRIIGGTSYDTFKASVDRLLVIARA